MYARYFKRVFDVSVSITLLVICSWLVLLIILLYTLTFNYPIFFRQPRIGRGEKIFNLFKFRTLKNSTEALSSRRFWLGNILRATSLDELPQLWNVLSGNMSLIGPRPLLAEYLPLFSDKQRIRHRVRPGITGWAQVNGKNSIGWQKKFEYDLYYVNNISFRLDCEILLKTIVLIISFRKDVSLNEEKFVGNDEQ